MKTCVCCALSMGLISPTDREKEPTPIHPIFGHEVVSARIRWGCTLDRCTRAPECVDHLWLAIIMNEVHIVGGVAMVRNDMAKLYFAVFYVFYCDLIVHPQW